MKFSHKILLIPLLVSVAFILIFVVTWRGGESNRRLLDQIESDFLASLELSHQLENTAVKVRHTLQDALMIEDADMILEADSLSDRFTSLIESGYKIQSMKKVTLTELQQIFEDYYKIARPVTIQMIDSDFNEELLASAAAMNAKYTDLVNELDDVTISQKIAMSDAFRNARRSYEHGQRIISITIAASLLMILLISMGTIYTILKPLREVMGATEAISRGDLNQKLEYQSHNEMGKLAESFRRMQRNLIADIERRENAEEKLRISEERMQMAIDAANDGLWDLNLKENDGYLSPRYLEMLDYKPGEIQPSLETVLELTHPEDVEKCKRSYVLHRDEDEEYNLEIRLHKKDDSWCWVNTRGKIVEWNNTSEPVRMVGTNVDITDRKHAEELLRQRTEELETANNALKQALKNLRNAQTRLIQSEKMAALGKLIAGITHEINNPLGAMISSSDNVAKAAAIINEGVQALEVSSQDHKLIKTIKLLKTNASNAIISGQRISRLVSSLKQFSHIDEAVYKAVDIHQGIDSTLTILEREIGDRIQVVRNYGKLPAVYCYPGEINQVFLHILSNAVNAIAEKGTITIDTKSDAGDIVISIADTGCGIDPDKRKRLFDFDFSMDASRVKMGWGLVTCKQIIDRHNGSIEVESQPGEGSIFKLILRQNKYS